MVRVLILLHSLLLPTISSGFVATNDRRGNRQTGKFASRSDSDESAQLASSSSSSQLVDRRSALEQSGIALSSLLLAQSMGVGDALALGDYDDSKKKRILITGANSGIGLDAAQRMALRGHEVTLACRTLEKAKGAVEKIKNNVANDADDAFYAIELIKSIKLVPMECDLADLASVGAFAKQLDGKFDAVCYNAGLARNTEAKDVARTKQGFELTVGTNHLGHFYLNRLLMPHIAESGRIVVTASSVHDPDSAGGAQGVPATLGQLEGLERAVSSGTGQFDMVNGGSFNADKAYKDSKLCNILFTRELQRRLDASGSNIKVNSFTPGLIVSTGLFRDQNQLFTKVFDVAATNLLKVGESISYGGGCLEYVALSEKVGEKGGLYYYSPPGSSKYGEEAYGKQFTLGEVSNEARASDAGLAKRFWELSDKLVGAA